MLKDKIAKLIKKKRKMAKLTNVWNEKESS